MKQVKMNALSQIVENIRLYESKLLDSQDQYDKWINRTMLLRYINKRIKVRQWIGRSLV